MNPGLLAILYYLVDTGQLTPTQAEWANNQLQFQVVPPNFIAAYNQVSMVVESAKRTVL